MKRDNNYLEQMFEMSPISSLTGLQPSMFDSSRPCSNQTPLQNSNVDYQRGIDVILHHTRTL